MENALIEDLQCTKVMPELLYNPLDAAKGEIRVLRLLKDLDAEGRIQCALHTISLDSIEQRNKPPGSSIDGDNNPQYKALSYEWGTPLNLQDITINGRSISIRGNLWHFLNFYRSQASNTTYLWIDQLSIDQANRVERNSQVAHMSRIYLLAVEVIAWLGPADDDELRVMRWLKHTISSRLDPLQQLMLETPTSPRRSRASWFKASPVISAAESSPQEQPCLPELIRKTYWTRLWIVQEVVLARDLVFYLGPFALSRDELKSYVEALFRIYKSINPSMASSQDIRRATIFNHIRSLADLKLHMSDRAGNRDVSCHDHTRPVRGPDELLPLEYVLTNLTELGECELKVDRIYGLQGLVTASQRIPIDYALPFSEVLGRVIDALIAAWQYPVSRVTCRFLWEQGRDGDVAERWRGAYRAAGDDVEFSKGLRRIQCAFAETRWQDSESRVQTIEDVQSFLKGGSGQQRKKPATW